MSETQLMIAIREACLLTGRVLLWRNNSGMLRAANGRAIRYGLGIGSPDLVGVVRGSGRLFALEVKSATGRESAEQRAWAKAVTDAGGFVRTVRSVDEALAAIREVST